MRIEEKKLILDEDDLKELFGLFTSVTKYERSQIYQRDSGHYFKETNLDKEYNLTQEKREFALDAWRAVLFFIHSKGYDLIKNEERIDISGIEEEFIE